jgi:uncharacterized delta-60 repeat protein
MSKSFFLPKKTACFLLTLFIFSFQSFAQNGAVDLAFSRETGPNGAVLSSAVQPDGKIILGGTFEGYASMSSPRLVRINSDGTRDNTFSLPGSFSGGNWIGALIEAIVVQPDGKILVGGEFTNFAGQAVNRLVRLNSNGSIDNSFIASNQIDDRIFALELLPTGQIMVGGLFTSNLLRLNSNGSLDNTFAAAITSTVNSIRYVGNGKIIIGGESDMSNFQQGPLLRLNQDGSLDNTFTLSSMFSSGEFENLELTADGKIIAATDWKVYRLTANGQVDPTFANLPFSSGNIVSIGLQSDGKVIVAGSFSQGVNLPGNCIARLNTDGTFDQSFDTGSGFNTSDYDLGITVMQVAILPDQTIVCGGYFHEFNSQNASYLVRLNSNGSLNWAVQCGAGAEATDLGDEIRTAITLPNGKIFVGGAFRFFDHVARSRVAMLRSDGYIDLSFNPGTGTEEGSVVYASACQSDGKILFGGQFTEYNGANHFGIARVLPSGAIDNTFLSGSGVGSGTVRAIALQDDGKIIIAGGFFQYNGTLVHNLVRLNSDGSPDVDFIANIPSGPDDQIYSIALQPDGKIILSGYFTHFNNTENATIVRLNTDGTLDDTFTSPFGSSTLWNIRDVCMQTDGKIIVGGKMALDGGQHVRRLNSDGTLDSDFFSYFPEAVQTVCMQPDGKILVGNNKIQRLLPNGLPDGQFQVLTGLSIFDITLTSLDNALVAGRLNFNSTNSITRLKTGHTQLSTDQNKLESSVVVFPNPTTENVIVKFDLQEMDMALAGVSGNVISTGVVQDGDSVSLAHLPNGVYLLILSSDSVRVVKRIVKE